MEVKLKMVGSMVSGSTQWKFDQTTIQLAIIVLLAHRGILDFWFLL
jgi:hypothetical protein